MATYYTFTKDQYKSMPKAQSASLGIKKASDGTYYTSKSAGAKFGGTATSTRPGSSSSSSSSSSSKTSSSSGKSTTVTRTTSQPAQTTSQPTTTSSSSGYPRQVTVEKNGQRTTVTETSPGLFGSLGYTYISGGPEPASGGTTQPTSGGTSQPEPTPQTTQGSGASDALRNLSIGLSQGDQITQEQINQGALQQGGQYDYVTQMGLEPNNASNELRNLSIALANQGQNTEAPMNVEDQQTGGRAEEINAAYAQQVAQNTGGGSQMGGGAGTNVPGATGAPNPSDGSMIDPTQSSPYISFNGAYFQETPQGLMAVADPGVIRGLKSGQIPSRAHDTSMTAGLTFGGGSIGPNGEIIMGTSPETAQIYQGVVDRFGFPTTPDQFYQDPISSIQDLFKTVLDTMGYGDAQEERRRLTQDIEDMENDKDEELRDIDDNPWLTEGVRLRERAKVERKYEDKLGNLYSKHELLNQIEDDARQQAQFALGTAISLWDSERRFQQEQLKLYTDQAQRQFDNEIKLASLALQERTSGTGDMQEYLFVKERGYQGSFMDFVKQRAAATRAPATGGATLGDIVVAGGGGPAIDAYTKAFNSVLVGLPSQTQKIAQKTFTNMMNSGDLKGAREYLVRLATQNLSTAQRDSAVGRAQATSALREIDSMLGQLEQKGVSTNLVTGSLEQVANRLGQTTDPDLLYIGNRIRTEIVNFRRAVSGAAFTESERQEYASIFPNISNVEQMNSALTASLLDSFDNNNRAVLSAYMGGDSNYNLIFGEPNSNLLPSLRTGASSGGFSIPFSGSGQMTQAPLAGGMTATGLNFNVYGGN